jgi:hypothetical protein
MSEYLNTLTVKTLREIAKQVGFRFISRYRKAELVNLLLAEIDACHTEAVREDKIRNLQSTLKVSHFDFPVPDGRTVTQAHVKICAQRGHGYYVKDGVDQGICPRCGILTMIDRDGKLTAVVQDGAPETDVPQVEPKKEIDLFLTELHTTLKDFMLRAEKHENAAYADDLFAENDTAEQWTTITKDLTRALGNVQWSIDYRHTCSFQREVGMSGCSYGCKIYRCETCGTDKEIHNATYGCRS